MPHPQILNNILCQNLPLVDSQCCKVLCHDTKSTWGIRKYENELGFYVVHSILRTILAAPVFFFFFFFFFPDFLGLHPWQMKVPWLWGKSELQLLAYTTTTATQDLSPIFDLHCNLGHHQILNPLSKGRSWTHILMDTNQVHYHWATMGTPRLTFNSVIMDRFWGPLASWVYPCDSKDDW